MTPWPLICEVARMATASPLLARLAFVSLEMVLLAGLIALLIRVLHVQTPRLRALLWLLVLAKPILGLTVGSPWPLFFFERPAALASAPVAGAPGNQSLALGRLAGDRPLSMMGLDDFDSLQPGMRPLGLNSQTNPQPSAFSGAWRFRSGTRFSLAALLIGLWGAGMALWGALTLRDLRRIRAIRAASCAPGAELAGRFSELAVELGLKSHPALRISAMLDSPALVGLFRPVVLLPGWMAERAETHKLDWLLRHELMHWKLNDPLALAVRRLAEILFYFHPLVWWAGRKWEEAMELACDRALLQSDADARGYAEQLYWVLENRTAGSRLPVRAGLCATRTQIGKRIASLLSNPLRFPARLSGPSLTGLMIAALLALSVGFGFQENSRAQDVNALNKESERIVRLVAMRNYVEAIPAAQALLAQAPSDAWRAKAHLRLAQAYAVKGIEYKDAPAQAEGNRQMAQALALDPALKSEPGVADIRALLAVTRQPVKACNQALEAAQKEVAQAPGEASAHNYLGMVYFHLGGDNEAYAADKAAKNILFEKAAAELKKATELDPKSIEQWGYLISALHAGGHTKEALAAGDLMLKMADLAPEKIPYRCNDPWVIISGLMSDKECREYDLRQAVLHPEYLDLQYRTILVNWMEKDPAQCRDKLEKLLNKITSGQLKVPPMRAGIEVSILYRLGSLYFNEGRGDMGKALERYRLIVQLSPNYADIHYNLGIVYRELASGAKDANEKAGFLKKAQEEFEIQVKTWGSKDNRVGKALGEIKTDLGKLEVETKKSAVTPSPVSIREAKSSAGEELARLQAMKKKDGRDNALIHYVTASGMMPAPENAQAELLKKVLAEGWSKAAEALLPYLQASRPALEEIRKGAALDYACNVDWGDGLSTPTPDFLAARNSAAAFCAEGRYLESQAKYEQALGDYLTVLTMSRDYGAGKSTLIGGIVGLSLEKIALSQLIPLAASGHLSRSQLEQVQGRLRTIETTQGSIDEWFAGERYVGLKVLELMRTDPVQAAGKVYGMTAVMKREKLTPKAMAALAGRLETEYKRYWEFCNRVWAIPYWQRDYDALNKEGEKMISSFHPLLLPLLMSVKEFTERDLVLKAKLREARLVTALALYKLAAGRYPATLAELVPGYLETQPVDPFGGGAFQYQLAPGGGTYSLYSVGPDQRNENGSVVYDPTNGTHSGGDIVLK